MEKKLKFLIVDDDPASASIQASLLQQKGHEVVTLQSSETALEQIAEIKPDCVLCDLMMPGLDGLDLFHSIRKIKNFSQPTFIVVTGKVFEYDQTRCFRSGVNGYLQKPVNPETFTQEVERLIEGPLAIKFWGIRGTLPVPGKKSVKFGGNTNCVTVRSAANHFLIFDAGTGIKELSNYLVKHHKDPIRGKIFISHPHYDHINGLPFFVPLYNPKNEFEILGTSQGDLSIAKIISGQMDTVYFPITIKEFAAKLSFKTLTEETFEIEDLKVTTIFLNHPGRCLGFRVQQRDKIFCYITDNELYMKTSPQFTQHEEDRIINFIKDADVVIMDATYTDKEYHKKAGWGHSSISRVVDVAHDANVKLLCLYHHDPDQTDKDIAAKLKLARALLKERNSTTLCIAPSEGDEIII